MRVHVNGMTYNKSDFYSLLLMDKIRALMKKNNSRLCVGLDVDGCGKHVIDATHDLVCAYKINPAFYESGGICGATELAELCHYLRTTYPQIAIILDGKRGDVGHSSQEYARAAFDELGVDAVTLNPYLGQDALEPFLCRKDKLCFILCRTSNPGADEFQDMRIDGVPLYKKVAERVAKSWNVNGNCGLIVGARKDDGGPSEMGGEKIRDIVGDDMIVLMPGVGAQGGDLLRTLRNLTNSKGDGVIVTVSRAIIRAEDVRAEAVRYRDKINALVACPRVVVMADPPGGWKYGFPKEYDEQTPLATWLAANGYPHSMISPDIDRHVRFFYKPMQNEREKIV